MRILVTGGAGYIGSHTCLALLEQGHEVVVFDNLYNASEESLNRVRKLTGKDLTFYKADMLDRDAMEKIFDTEKIDAVIHFAGLKAVGESVEKPWEYYYNNITGSLILLDVMRKHGVKKIIFSSSATVYGDPASKYQNDAGDSDIEDTGLLDAASRQIAVNAYAPLYFSSFLEKNDPKPSVLKYELEYLLAGKKSDRENLKDAVNRVVTLRGAMTLLWAFGEAVSDTKTLLAGGKIPFWKTAETWKTSLSGLLDQSFLRETEENSAEGRTYTEYLNCLMFLMDRKTRNFRMMDLIQWNIRMDQADFSAENCAYRIEIEAEVLQKHMFFQKEEYKGTVYAAGSY